MPTVVPNLRTNGQKSQFLLAVYLDSYPDVVRLRGIRLPNI